MRGLLIKDYYMLIKYFRSYILIITVMAVVTMFSTSAPLFILYPVIMANMLPVSLVNYDEMARFDRMYQTMPVSKAQYVSAKYLMSFIFQALSLIIFTAGYSVSLIRSSQFEIDTVLTIVSYMIILVSVLPSILLPFVFKFGSEKGRMVYLLITAVFVGAVMYLLNKEELFMIDISAFGFIKALIISILVYGVSWFISVRIYKKREIA
ncbi:MAG: ABC-2 transporter permease [Erysipelotrichaceae bacterium]